jgi:hypothetical protein
MGEQIGRIGLWKKVFGGFSTKAGRHWESVALARGKT